MLQQSWMQMVWVTVLVTSCLIVYYHNAVAYSNTHLSFCSCVGQESSMVWLILCLKHHRIMYMYTLLEKKMVTHPSDPAWKIPRTEEAGGLQPMGWQRVGHDWACMQPVTQSYTEANWNQNTIKGLQTPDLWFYNAHGSLDNLLGVLLDPHSSRDLLHSRVAHSPWAAEEQIINHVMELPVP